MNQDPVRVSQVHWTRAFPLLRLFESASLGCSLSAVVLAYTCLAISATGSSLINAGLADNSAGTLSEFSWPELSHLEGGLHREIRHVKFWQTGSLFPPPVSSLRVSVRQTYFEHSLLASLFPRDLSRLSPWLFSTVMMLWNALVLGFFGTAISRTVATQFCLRSPTGILAAVRFAWQRWRDTLLAAGLVFVFLTVLKMFLGIADLVSRTSNVGELAVSIFWVMIFIVAVGLTLAFVVLGVAWLLSLAAIGTDGCSGTDSLSRSISYLLSHRLWSTSGVLVVTAIALTIRWLMEIMTVAGIGALSAQLINADLDAVRRGWMLAIYLIPHAVHLSVFLAGITLLYVLLRQREDGISTEEIDGAV